QVWSGELEVTRHFSPLWTGVASASFSTISDIIELRTAPGRTDVSEYQNGAAPIRALGFEAELRREWRQGWMAAATYSFSRVRYDAPGLRNVPNSPQHLGSLKIAVPVLLRALTAMTRVSVEGPRWDRNSSPDDPPPDGPRRGAQASLREAALSLFFGRSRIHALFREVRRRGRPRVAAAALRRPGDGFEEARRPPGRHRRRRRVHRLQYGRERRRRVHRHGEPDLDAERELRPRAPVDRPRRHALGPGADRRARRPRPRRPLRPASWRR